RRKPPLRRARLRVHRWADWIASSAAVLRLLRSSASQAPDVAQPAAPAADAKARAAAATATMRAADRAWSRPEARPALARVVRLARGASTGGPGPHGTLPLA